MLVPRAARPGGGWTVRGANAPTQAGQTAARVAWPCAQRPPRRRALDLLGYCTVPDTASLETTSAPSQRILDLGCGRDKLPGAVGMDQNPRSDADIIHDLD